ncbi:hypothetical protein JW948_01520 [bacterium]|nr:hypothetical protein [bacterium]
MKRMALDFMLCLALVGTGLSQKMTVKDSESHVLMEVNDEGDAGSISLPQGSTPSSTAGKLYNVGGALYWNGSALGMAGSAGGWTDNGANVYTTTSTDKVGIGTSSPEFRLSIDNDGGILAKGTYGSGAALSTSGTGTRMIWYPRKAAFRAGDVSSGEWNDGNIGDYSTATGYSTTASGAASTAMGYSTTASGYYSTSMGAGTGAGGHYSTAMGAYTTAGGDMSTAMGGWTNASSYLSMAIGQWNVGGGNATSWVSTDPLFEIGIGSGSSARANALTVFKNGKIGINGTSPASKLTIRTGAEDNVPILGFDDTDGDNTYYFEANFLGTGASGNYLSMRDHWANTLQTWRNGRVGIGDSSPTHTLDVAGKVGINDTQILYLPDQTNFTGTLYLGNGGGSLSHTSGGEGQSNTAVGIGALNANTTGHNNTAIGINALVSNTTGFINTASGVGALSSNTTGCFNTASGYDALGSNTTGSANTACGSSALSSNTTGHYNTAIGYFALIYNNTGQGNVGIGWGSNYYNQAGSNNTIIGFNAGSGTSLHDKSGNIFIGYEAGYNETGSNKLYIENSNSTAPLIGGDFSTNRVGINSKTPSVTLEILGTDAVKVPVGTTAERPASPSSGMVRFNTTTTKLEVYTGTAWADLH